MLNNLLSYITTRNKKQAYLGRSAEAFRIDPKTGRYVFDDDDEQEEDAPPPPPMVVKK